MTREGTGLMTFGTKGCPPKNGRQKSVLSPKERAPEIFLLGTLAPALLGTLAPVLLGTSAPVLLGTKRF